MGDDNIYLDLAVFCGRCEKICNVPEDVDIEIKVFSGGEHHTAYCKACNGYIKNLSQNKPMDTLPYGKYKGEAFLDVARRDKSYIVWLMNADRTSTKIKEACNFALKLVKDE